MSINIKGQIILFNKLDTSEYEFNMTYEYLDYCGKSFLKELNFVEDMEEYFKQSNIILEHFSDHAILTLPIPFSKKVVLVKLNRPKNDSNTEIHIELLKQKDRIEKLEARLAEYDAKEEIMKRCTSAELDLIYEKDRGFYFDYDGYLSRDGADEKALETFKEILNDYYGFGTEVEICNHNGTNVHYYGNRATVCVRTYTSTGLIGSMDKYVCDLFDSVDAMLEQLHKPYMNQLHNTQHYACFYSVLDLFQSVSSYRVKSILKSNSLIWRKRTYFNSKSIFKTNRFPYDEICDILKTKSFKAASYNIKRETQQHTKFLVGWNGGSEVDKQINDIIFKKTEGNVDALTNMRVTDIGPYRYLFY